MTRIAPSLETPLDCTEPCPPVYRGVVEHEASSDRQMLLTRRCVVCPDGSLLRARGDLLDLTEVPHMTWGADDPGTRLCALSLLADVLSVRRALTLHTLFALQWLRHLRAELPWALAREDIARWAEQAEYALEQV